MSKLRNSSEQSATKGSILFMLENCKTPIKRPQLLQHLRNNGHHLSDRDMRSLIESMISEDGHLIESSDKGYSIITTSEQFAKATKYLHKKSLSLLMREFYLTRNWKSKNALLFV